MNARIELLLLGFGEFRNEEREEFKMGVLKTTATQQKMAVFYFSTFQSYDSFYYFAFLCLINMYCQSHFLLSLIFFSPFFLIVFVFSI